MWVDDEGEEGSKQDDTVQIERRKGLDTVKDSEDECWRTANIPE